METSDDDSPHPCGVLEFFFKRVLCSMDRGQTREKRRATNVSTVLEALDALARDSRMADLNEAELNVMSELIARGKSLPLFRQGLFDIFLLCAETKKNVVPFDVLVSVIDDTDAQGDVDWNAWETQLEKTTTKKIAALVQFINGPDEGSDDGDNGDVNMHNVENYKTVPGPDVYSLIAKNMDRILVFLSTIDVAASAAVLPRLFGLLTLALERLRGTVSFAKLDFVLKHFLQTPFTKIENRTVYVALWSLIAVVDPSRVNATVKSTLEALLAPMMLSLEALICGINAANDFGFHMWLDMGPRCFNRVVELLGTVCDRTESNAHLVSELLHLIRNRSKVGSEEALPVPARVAVVDLENLFILLLPWPDPDMDFLIFDIARDLVMYKIALPNQIFGALRAAYLKKTAIPECKFAESRLANVLQIWTDAESETNRVQFAEECFSLSLTSLLTLPETQTTKISKLRWFSTGLPQILKILVPNTMTRRAQFNGRVKVGLETASSACEDNFTSLFLFSVRCFEFGEKALCRYEIVRDILIALNVASDEDLGIRCSDHEDREYDSYFSSSDNVYRNVGIFATKAVINMFKNAFHVSDEQDKVYMKVMLGVLLQIIRFVPLWNATSSGTPESTVYLCLRIDRTLDSTQPQRLALGKEVVAHAVSKTISAQLAAACLAHLVQNEPVFSSIQASGGAKKSKAITAALFRVVNDFWSTFHAKEICALMGESDPAALKQCQELLWFGCFSPDEVALRDVIELVFAKKGLDESNVAFTVGKSLVDILDESHDAYDDDGIESLYKASLMDATPGPHFKSHIQLILPFVRMGFSQYVGDSTALFTGLSDNELDDVFTFCQNAEIECFTEPLVSRVVLRRILRASEFVLARTKLFVNTRSMEKFAEAVRWFYEDMGGKTSSDASALLNFTALFVKETCKQIRESHGARSKVSLAAALLDENFIEPITFALISTASFLRCQNRLLVAFPELAANASYLTAFAGVDLNCALGSVFAAITMRDDDVKEFSPYLRPFVLQPLPDLIAVLQTYMIDETHDFMIISAVIYAMLEHFQKNEDELAIVVRFAIQTMGYLSDRNSEEYDLVVEHLMIEVGKSLFGQEPTILLAADSQLPGFEEFKDLGPACIPMHRAFVELKSWLQNHRAQRVLAVSLTATSSFAHYRTTSEPYPAKQAVSVTLASSLLPETRGVSSVIEKGVIASLAKEVAVLASRKKASMFPSSAPIQSTELDESSNNTEHCHLALMEPLMRLTAERNQSRESELLWLLTHNARNGKIRKGKASVTPRFLTEDEPVSTLFGQAPKRAVDDSPPISENDDEDDEDDDEDSAYTSMSDDDSRASDMDWEAFNLEGHFASLENAGYRTDTCLGKASNFYFNCLTCGKVRICIACVRACHAKHSIVSNGQGGGSESCGCFSSECLIRNATNNLDSPIAGGVGVGGGIIRAFKKVATFPLRAQRPLLRSRLTILGRDDPQLLVSLSKSMVSLSRRWQRLTNKSWVSTNLDMALDPFSFANKFQAIRHSEVIGFVERMFEKQSPELPRQLLDVAIAKAGVTQRRLTCNASAMVAVAEGNFVTIVNAASRLSFGFDAKLGSCDGQKVWLPFDGSSGAMEDLLQVDFGFPPIQIEFNQITGETMTVAGLTSCSILSLGLNVAAIRAEAVLPLSLIGLHPNDVICRVLWVPDSKSELAIVTSTCVKFFDIYDSNNPLRSYRLPEDMSAIVDATFVPSSMSPKTLILLNRAGSLLKQDLSVGDATDDLLLCDVFESHPQDSNARAMFLTANPREIIIHRIDRSVSSFVLKNADEPTSANWALTFHSNCRPENELSSRMPPGGITIAIKNKILTTNIITRPSGTLMCPTVLTLNGSPHYVSIEIMPPQSHGNVGIVGMAVWGDERFPRILTLNDNHSGGSWLNVFMFPGDIPPIPARDFVTSKSPPVDWFAHMVALHASDLSDSVSNACDLFSPNLALTSLNVVVGRGCVVVPRLPIGHQPGSTTHGDSTSLGISSDVNVKRLLDPKSQYGIASPKASQYPTWESLDIVICFAHALWALGGFRLYFGFDCQIETLPRCIEVFSRKIYLGPACARDAASIYQPPIVCDILLTPDEMLRASACGTVTLKIFRQKCVSHTVLDGLEMFAIENKRISSLDFADDELEAYLATEQLLRGAGGAKVQVGDGARTSKRLENLLALDFGTSVLKLVHHKSLSRVIFKSIIDVVPEALLLNADRLFADEFEAEKAKDLLEIRVWKKQGFDVETVIQLNCLGRAALKYPRALVSAFEENQQISMDSLCKKVKGWISKGTYRAEDCLPAVFSILLGGLCVNEACRHIELFFQTPDVVVRDATCDALLSLFLTKNDRMASAKSLPSALSGHFKCDVCLKSPIREFRMNCVTCGDFDACGDCFFRTRFEHSECHEFIRFTIEASSYSNTCCLACGGTIVAMVRAVGKNAFFKKNENRCSVCIDLGANVAENAKDSSPSASHKEVVEYFLDPVRFQTLASTSFIRFLMLASRCVVRPKHQGGEVIARILISRLAHLLGNATLGSADEFFALASFHFGLRVFETVEDFSILGLGGIDINEISNRMLRICEDQLSLQIFKRDNLPCLADAGATDQVRVVAMNNPLALNFFSFDFRAKARVFLYPLGCFARTWAKTLKNSFNVFWQVLALQRDLETRNDFVDSNLLQGHFGVRIKFAADIARVAAMAGNSDASIDRKNSEKNSAKAWQKVYMDSAGFNVPYSGTLLNLIDSLNDGVEFEGSVRTKHFAKFQSYLGFLKSNADRKTLDSFIVALNRLWRFALMRPTAWVDLCSGEFETCNVHTGNPIDVLFDAAEFLNRNDLNPAVALCLINAALSEDDFEREAGQPIPARFLPLALNSSLIDRLFRWTHDDDETTRMFANKIIVLGYRKAVDVQILDQVQHRALQAVSATRGVLAVTALDLITKLASEKFTFGANAKKLFDDLSNLLATSLGVLNAMCDAEFVHYLSAAVALQAAAVASQLATGGKGKSIKSKKEKDLAISKRMLVLEYVTHNFTDSAKKRVSITPEEHLSHVSEGCGDMSPELEEELFRRRVARQNAAGAGVESAKPSATVDTGLLSAFGDHTDRQDVFQRLISPPCTSCSSPYRPFKSCGSEELTRQMLYSSNSVVFKFSSLYDLEGLQIDFATTRCGSVGLIDSIVVSSCALYSSKEYPIDIARLFDDSSKWNVIATLKQFEPSRGSALMAAKPSYASAIAGLAASNANNPSPALASSQGISGFSWMSFLKYTGTAAIFPAVPTTLLKIEYILVKNNRLEADRVTCPRCGRPVSGDHGVCSFCSEMVHQCRNCRNINYANLKSFLCEQCGTSRHGKFTYRFSIRKSTHFPDVLNDEDALGAREVLDAAALNLASAWEKIPEYRKRAFEALVMFDVTNFTLAASSPGFLSAYAIVHFESMVIKTVREKLARWRTGGQPHAAHFEEPARGKCFVCTYSFAVEACAAMSVLSRVQPEIVDADTRLVKTALAAHDFFARLHKVHGLEKHMARSLPEETLSELLLQIVRAQPSNATLLMDELEPRFRDSPMSQINAMNSVFVVESVVLECIRKSFVVNRGVRLLQLALRAFNANMGSTLTDTQLRGETSASMCLQAFSRIVNAAKEIEYGRGEDVPMKRARLG